MLVRVMPNYTRRQSYLYTIFDPPCTLRFSTRSFRVRSFTRFRQTPTRARRADRGDLSELDVARLSCKMHKARKFGLRNGQVSSVLTTVCRCRAPCGGGMETLS